MVKEFPLSPLEKIARNAGAERISYSALEEMRLILLELSNKLAINAIAACNHAKRVTIKKEDIRIANR